MPADTPSPAQLQHWLPVAIRAADRARKEACRYYRTPVSVHTKPDDSPVSHADVAVETAIRAVLTEHAPDHPILGEEQGGDVAQCLEGWAWVIDPIDGTRAFLAGIPTFGVLIALCWRGTPVIGIIEQPILQDRWVGVAGQPTTLNGQPIRTRPCPSLGDATLSTSSPFLFADSELAAVHATFRAAKSTVYGKDCIAYGLLAAGWVDGVIESGLKAHDVMALVPVVEGAGGMLRHWDGAKLTITHCSHTLAVGDGALFQALQQCLHTRA